MRLERRQLDELAADTGFRPETLEKVIRLGDFVSDIGRHPLLSKVLVLKGGTALHLSFGAPRRLSVDLDFNYVGSLDRAKMLQDRPTIEDALESLGSRKKYRVQRSAEEHAGRKLFLTYRSATGSDDRLEIDVNYLFREPLPGVERRALWQPGTIARPSVNVVSLEELCAGKICALLSRVAPRDLFDVTLLPKIVGRAWIDRRFRRIIVAFSAVLDHSLDRYGKDRLERVSDQEIRRQLLPMLQRDHSVSAPELALQAWAAMEPILDLEPEEREFVTLVQHGELRPKILFGEDDDLSERFRRHPALLWKVGNARRFSSLDAPTED